MKIANFEHWPEKSKKFNESSKLWTLTRKNQLFCKKPKKQKKGGSFKDNSTKTPTAESQTQCINIFIIPKKKKKNANKTQLLPIILKTAHKAKGMLGLA